MRAVREGGWWSNMTEKNIEQSVVRISEQVKLLVELNQRQRTIDAKILRAAWEVIQFMISLVPVKAIMIFAADYSLVRREDDLSWVDFKEKCFASPERAIVKFADITPSVAQRLSEALCRGLFDQLTNTLNSELAKSEVTEAVLRSALPNEKNK
jgi:hypothetical protein